MATALVKQCRWGVQGLPSPFQCKTHSAATHCPAVCMQTSFGSHIGLRNGIGKAVPGQQSAQFSGRLAALLRDAQISGVTWKPKRVSRCAAVVASASGDLQEKREELKGKLRTSLEGNIGNLTEEELSLIDQLAKITPDPEPAKNLEMVKGGYRLLNSTMPNVLYRGAKLTLGRATFNMYPPADLQMTLHEVYNEVDGGKYYDVYQDVTLEPEGLPTMKAKILNRAEYVLEGDKRISVEFTESKVTPAEGTDLAAWKKVFQDNADMEEDGTMKRVFPKGKPGWVDILYQDQSFRITKGNFGNIVIVEREA